MRHRIPHAPHGYCMQCCVRMELEDLELDHHDGRTWRWHSLSAYGRAVRAWHEFDRGVRFRALCKPCNSSHGTRTFRGRPRFKRRRKKR